MLLAGVLITGIVFPMLPRGFDVAASLEQEKGVEEGRRLSPVFTFQETRPTETIGKQNRERLRQKLTGTPAPTTRELQ